MRTLQLTAEDMRDLAAGRTINAMIEGGEEVITSAPDGIGQEDPGALMFTQAEDNEVRVTFKGSDVGISTPTFAAANTYIEAGIAAGHKREDYEVQIRKVFKFVSPWVRA